MKLPLKSPSTGSVFMSCAESGKDIQWYSDMMRRESRRRKESRKRGKESRRRGKESRRREGRRIGGEEGRRVGGEAGE